MPASLSLIFETRLLEAMTLALPDERGEHTLGGVEPLAAAAAARGGALVLGPGLGRGDAAAAFARGVLEAVALPVVLDADGLNAYAGALDALSGRAAVLTPHEGELARLLGATAATVASARLRYAREAASRAGAVVVLKGDDTLVAAPGGLVAVSPGATPALATAGTGDVLAGVIAAMLAKGLEPFEAACAAVRLTRGPVCARGAPRRRGPDRLRRRRGALGGALAGMRGSLASIWPRSSATAHGSCDPVRGCARSSRRTPTAMVPSSARGPRSPAAPRGSPSPPRRRPTSCGKRVSTRRSS